MIKRVRSNPERRRRLFRAAYDGDLETIKTLISEGEDINVRGERGHRLINILADADSQPGVKWLLENGAMPNALDPEGQSPLIKAIINRNVSMVTLLLESGASPDLFGKSEHPAVWVMTTKGDDQVLNRILDSIADIDVCDQGGKTLLFAAIEADRADWVTNFIERGANLNHRDSLGGTALHVASQTSATMVELLLPHFADLNPRDFSLRTPLHRTEKTDSIRALVAAGADINARDRTGNTPLVTAINTGYYAKMPTFQDKYRPAMMELMALGADLDAQNDREESARSLIKHYKIKELQRALAALNARNSMASIVTAANARAARAGT